MTMGLKPAHMSCAHLERNTVPGNRKILDYLGEQVYKKMFFFSKYLFIKICIQIEVVTDLSLADADANFSIFDL